MVRAHQRHRGRWGALGDAKGHGHTREMGDIGATGATRDSKGNRGTLGDTRDEVDFRGMGAVGHIRDTSDVGDTWVWGHPGDTKGMGMLVSTGDIGAPGERDLHRDQGGASDILQGVTSPHVTSRAGSDITPCPPSPNRDARGRTRGQWPYPCHGPGPPRPGRGRGACGAGPGRWPGEGCGLPATAAPGRPGGPVPAPGSPVPPGAPMAPAPPGSAPRSAPAAPPEGRILALSATVGTSQPSTPSATAVMSQHGTSLPVPPQRPRSPASLLVPPR